jgi:hypothetical protein
MCGQGDEEIIENWMSRGYTISRLKRECEQKNYSAFTVCANGAWRHAGLKNFEFELLKKHCKPNHGCVIYIYTPPTHKRKPPGSPKPRLILVNKNDKNRCIFNVAQLLPGALDVPLTLVNFPGYAITKVHDNAKDAWEWKYIELQCSSSAEAEGRNRLVKVNVEGDFLAMPGSGTGQQVKMVFDVSFWKLEARNTVNLVGHGQDNHGKTYQGGGGRDWVVNKDGSVSPKNAMHLELGLEFVPPPIQSVPRAQPELITVDAVPVSSNTWQFAESVHQGVQHIDYQK